MKTTLTDIHQIVNPAKFQKIQEDISQATELALITVDYKGVPLTTHSNCSEFCKKVRSSRYGEYCEKCDSHGGLEAARIRKPFIYLCHAGLVDFAIPIIVDDLYLGAFMAGQVLLAPEDSEHEPEHILHRIDSTIDISRDASLQESYSKLPIMRLTKIIALANMILHIGNYCVEVAILNQTVARITSKDKKAESDKTPDYSYDSSYNNTKTIINRPARESNKLLEPAYAYIKKHPGEKISLAKIATLCNISPSYFSKLFAKENTGNLSDYVNHVKVERAKELLYNTDWSVRTIAESLGYDDCGYFIKVFKRETQKTPLEYRNDFTTTSISKINIMNQL